MLKKPLSKCLCAFYRHVPQQSSAIQVCLGLTLPRCRYFKDGLTGWMDRGQGFLADRLQPDEHRSQGPFCLAALFRSPETPPGKWRRLCLLSAAECSNSIQQQRKPVIISSQSDFDSDVQEIELPLASVSLQHQR